WTGWTGWTGWPTMNRDHHVNAMSSRCSLSRPVRTYAPGANGWTNVPSYALSRAQDALGRNGGAARVHGRGHDPTGRIIRTHRFTQCGIECHYEAGARAQSPLV